MPDANSCQTPAYRGSEMGLPEAVVDWLHAAASTTIVQPATQNRACCCLDDAAGVYAGSEMGLPDARVEALHAEAAAALAERRAKFAAGRHKRCSDCPKSRLGIAAGEPNDRG